MSAWDEFYKGKSKLDSASVAKMMQYLSGEIPAQIPSSAVSGGGGGTYNPPIPISDVSSLQSSLDGKSSTSHNHTGTYEPVLPSKSTNALKYLQVDAGETAFQYGTPSGGSVNIKETEIDFGTALAQTEKVFTITDADVSASSQLIASLSYQAPTSKDQDEVEMDDFSIRCMPGTGQFDMFVNSLNGAVHDKFKVNYLVG